MQPLWPAGPMAVTPEKIHSSNIHLRARLEGRRKPSRRTDQNAASRLPLIVTYGLGHGREQTFSLNPYRRRNITSDVQDEELVARAMVGG